MPRKPRVPPAPDAVDSGRSVDGVGLDAVTAGLLMFGVAFTGAGLAAGVGVLAVLAGLAVVVDLAAVAFTGVSFAGFLPLAGAVLAAALGAGLLAVLVGFLAVLDPLGLGFLTTIRVLLHHEVKGKPTFLPKTLKDDKGLDIKTWFPNRIWSVIMASPDF